MRQVLVVAKSLLEYFSVLFVDVFELLYAQCCELLVEASLAIRFAGFWKWTHYLVGPRPGPETPHRSAKKSALDTQLALSGDRACSP